MTTTVRTKEMPKPPSATTKLIIDGKVAINRDNFGPPGNNYLRIEKKRILLIIKIPKKSQVLS